MDMIRNSLKLNTLAPKESDLGKASAAPENIKGNSKENIKIAAPDIQIKDSPIILTGVELADHVLAQELDFALTSALPVKVKPSDPDTKLTQYQQFSKPIEKTESQALSYVTQHLHQYDDKNLNLKVIDTAIYDAVAAIESGYLRTSNILSGLGALDRGVDRYIQKSQTRVLDGVQDIKSRYENGLNQNYKDLPVEKRDSLSLVVKTREGDEVKIDIRYDDNRYKPDDKSYGLEFISNELSVSYKVEGDLSKSEQEALQKLISGLGEVADQFFSNKGQLDEYIDLSRFNFDQLASFKLALKDYPALAADPKDRRDVALQQFVMEYSVNAESAKQTISVNYNDETHVGEGKEDSYGYQITTALQRAGFDVLQPSVRNESYQKAKESLAHLEEQIDFSVSQLNDKSSKSGEFYKNGLRQMLGFSVLSQIDTAEKIAPQTPVKLAVAMLSELVQKHPLAKKIGNLESSDNNTQNKAALTGLADFDATFSAKRDGDAGTYLNQKEFNLNLSQKTKVESYQLENTLVEETMQKKAFDLTIVQQELREQGTQRVVESIDIKNDTQTYGRYIDGLLTVLKNQVSQSVDKKTEQYTDSPMGYIAKQRLFKPINYNFDRLDLLKMIRQTEALFKK